MQYLKGRRSLVSSTVSFIEFALTVSVSNAILCVCPAHRLLIALLIAHVERLLYQPHAVCFISSSTGDCRVMRWRLIVQVWIHPSRLYRIKSYLEKRHGRAGTWQSGSHSPPTFSCSLFKVSICIICVVVMKVIVKQNAPWEISEVRCGLRAPRTEKRWMFRHSRSFTQRWNKGRKTTNHDEWSWFIH